jgi:DNA-binding MarR family transcriptional regulator
MRVNEAREVRGMILRMCEINKPYGCSEQLISLALQENQFSVSPSLLKGHIDYLEEKGYVRAEDHEHYGIQRSIVFLTAKGTDLLEGNIPADPGIMLPDMR